jgi:hypothetical protein
MRFRPKSAKTHNSSSSDDVCIREAAAVLAGLRLRTIQRQGISTRPDEVPMRSEEVGRGLQLIFLKFSETSAFLSRKSCPRKL